MIVVPLILSSIIVGVRNMASQNAFGRIGGKTVAFYVATGLLSVCTGLVCVNLIAPGETESARALGTALPDSSQVMDKVEGRGIRDLVEVLKRAIPSNIFAAALEVQLLALVFVGVVFGYFMSRLNGPAGDTLQRFWVGLHDLMILITMWIMRFAPIGAFALVGKTLLISGFAALEALGLFFLTVLLALVVHFAVWLPLLLRLVAGISPYAYYAKIAPAQLTAFSTASSSATLPVTINSAEQAGISNRVTSFVLPLGATVNMDGTALYECVVVVFIAQVYAFASGVDFGIAEQMIVVLLALLTSIGVAGIPAAKLGRHCTDPAGGRPAGGSHRHRLGRRSPARYVPHGRQCDQRSGGHGASGAHRRRKTCRTSGLDELLMLRMGILGDRCFDSASLRSA